MTTVESNQLRWVVCACVCVCVGGVGWGMGKAEPGKGRLENGGLGNGESGP